MELPQQHAKTREVLLSHLYEQELPGGRGRRSLRLWSEAAIFTLISTFVAHAFGAKESGFISIFLSAAALAPRVRQILEENRDNIWKRGLPALKTNLLTAQSMFALFLGSLTAFIVLALVMGEGWALESFGFALEATRLGEDTLLTRRFPSFFALLVHNSMVLFAFAVLSFIYGAYGALLVLNWNACAWGFVLTFLVSRGLASSEIAAPQYLFFASIALGPHLLLEGMGYVTGSLAAIFLAKGLGKYALGDEDRRLRRVLLAVLVLALIAVALVALAAVAESTLTHLMIHRLRPH